MVGRGQAELVKLPERQIELKHAPASCSDLIFEPRERSVRSNGEGMAAVRDLELESRAAEVFGTEQHGRFRMPFEGSQAAPAVRIDGGREIEVRRGRDLDRAHGEPGLGRKVEATVGIEPTDKGFADLCLTTWL